MADYTFPLEAQYIGLFLLFMILVCIMAIVLPRRVERKRRRRSLVR